jgi:hypothetical protein
MDNFMNWEYISTFTGIVFCTQMVVEYLKEIKYIKSIPTKYFTSIVAFILLLGANIFTGVFEISNIPLLLLNSILITFTATGGKDFSYRKVTSKEDTSTINGQSVQP